MTRCMGFLLTGRGPSPDRQDHARTCVPLPPRPAESRATGRSCALMSTPRPSTASCGGNRPPGRTRCRCRQVGRRFPDRAQPDRRSATAASPFLLPRQRHTRWNPRVGRRPPRSTPPLVPGRNCWRSRRRSGPPAPRRRCPSRTPWRRARHSPERSSRGRPVRPAGGSCPYHYTPLLKRLFHLCHAKPMTDTTATDFVDGSPRKAELLERAYRYALEHGVANLSLRPLASAIGSSPRVLLYLFGSKDGLVRALLARARAEELALLEELRSNPGSDLKDVVARIWEWLAAEERRGLLSLWVEGYARSLIDPDGPWAGFAKATVDDWFALRAEYQPANQHDSDHATTQRTEALALLRGALLDLLATGDRARTTATIRAWMAQ